MDLETALNSLEHALAEARPVPLSASVMVNKEDLERIAQAIRTAMPEEIRQARWVLRERDQLLAQASRDAEQIVADGHLERDRLLADTEIVREAHREAQRIVDRAAEEGRKIRHEAEDFVDAKLGDFEVVLQKTLSTVTKGRDRLRGRQASAEIQMAGEDVTLPAGMPVSEGQPAEDGAQASRASRFFDHEQG
jgi:F0F1-type ATP synthase membrane subunit b/b'